MSFSISRFNVGCVIFKGCAPCYINEMYLPKHFRQTNEQLINSILNDYSFATLIESGPKSTEVAHVPVLGSLNGKQSGVIRGHLAKANPVSKLLGKSSESLIIFHGPHCYVSPTWYGTSGHVPTWNYVAIHVYGKSRVFTDKESLLQLLENMSEKYEANLSNPWKPDLTSTQRQVLLRMIVGFEIEIKRVESKFKLSQNRKPEERKNVITRLESSKNQNDLEVARIMRSLDV